jgi:transporter family protein
MWVTVIIFSAIFLGFYDVFKKASLRGNVVMLVMLISSATSLCILLPFILISHFQPELLQDSMFFIPFSGGKTQWMIFLKSILVLASWIFSFYAMKYLPISIVSPIRSSAPLWTLLGAVLLLHESLNGYQWTGILLIIACLFAYSVIGKKEGIRFTHDIWILFIFVGTILGSISSLFDKYLIDTLKISRMEIQAWFSVYQFLLMIPCVMLIWFPHRKTSDKFQWRWTIPMIGIFLVFADFFYYYALSMPGALIAVISPIRRSNVLISFLGGALIFKEKNIAVKGIALIGVILGVYILYLGR